MTHWYNKHKNESDIGGRIADKVASAMGSWCFIIIQSIVVVLWLGLNGVAFIYKWDPYPFILLNLIFSTQAAYATPLIMMSQNRASDRDRQNAEADHLNNQQAKLEIEQLIAKLDKIESEKLDKILKLLDK